MRYRRWPFLLEIAVDEGLTFAFRSAIKTPYVLEALQGKLVAIIAVDLTLPDALDQSRPVHPWWKLDDGNPTLGEVRMDGLI